MASPSMFGKLRAFASYHPLVRGILSYGVLWPTGCAIQQIIEGKTLSTFSWKRCFRFSAYGACFVAPAMYTWMRLANAMWPSTTLKIGIIKACVEQISYAPFAISCFYMGMNLLELKTLSDGFAEWKQKFLPTWRVGMCLWPIVQTINFSLVPERNRVVFVSIVSVMWTVFLAYMKHLRSDKLQSK